MTLEELFNEYYDYLYRSVLRYTHNREDAEDALQNTWLKLCRSGITFEGRSSVASWLYRIVINFALMKKRRWHPEFSLDDTDESGRSWAESIPDPAPSLEETITALEREEWLANAIRTAHLPCSQQMAVLQMLNEETAKESSMATGKPTGNIKAAQHCARRTLRQALLDLQA